MLSEKTATKLSAISCQEHFRLETFSTAEVLKEAKPNQVNCLTLYREMYFLTLPPFSL